MRTLFELMRVVKWGSVQLNWFPTLLIVLSVVTN